MLACLCLVSSKSHRLTSFMSLVESELKTDEYRPKFYNLLAALSQCDIWPRCSLNSKVFGLNKQDLNCQKVSSRLAVLPYLLICSVHAKLS